MILMLSLDHSDHARVVELCARAVLGDADAGTSALLRVHLERCSACREALSAMAIAVIEDQRGRPTAEDEARWRRFLARCRTRGLVISEAVQTSGRGRALGPVQSTAWRYAAACVAVAVALVGGLSVVRELRGREKDSRPLFQTDYVLAAEKKAPPVISTRPPEKDSRPLLLARRVADLENQLRTVTAERDTAIATAAAGGRQLEERLALVAQELAGLRQAAEALHAGRTGDAGTIAVQDRRIAELEAALDDQHQILQRERELLAAGRDVRDLMGARNLHVVDVFDVDGRGRTQRTFGRVFYTEGKSLIFYAFDLDQRRNVADRAFQAWGLREAASGAAQSLGIFYADDHNQHRWVLKFDNPTVLAQIDAVFVTVEPAGGSARPSGQKLLYAYLNGNANHP